MFMINNRHPVAIQLQSLCDYLERTPKKDRDTLYQSVARSIQITSIHHFGKSKSYCLDHGKATSDQAFTTYHHIAKTYPELSELLLICTQNPNGMIIIKVDDHAQPRNFNITQADKIGYIPQTIGFFRSPLSF